MAGTITIGNGFKAMAGTIVSALTTATGGLYAIIAAIGATVAALGGWVIGRYGVAGGKFEQLRISFDVLLGSAEAGKKMLEEITQFASVTPFDTEGLSEAAKTLLSFGVAQNKYYL